VTTSQAEIGVELEKALRALVGKPCWTVFAGPETGSAIDIHFGSKIPRLPPLRNPALSDDERRYEGEFSLYITCAWRMTENNQVVYGWTDAADDPAALNSTLEHLVGRTVIAMDVKPTAWDLSLQFGSDLILDIFCDQTSLVDEDDNYALFTPSRLFNVGPRSRLAVELRDPDEPDADEDHVSEWIQRLRRQSLKRI